MKTLASVAVTVLAFTVLRPDRAIGDAPASETAPRVSLGTLGVVEDGLLTRAIVSVLAPPEAPAGSTATPPAQGQQQRAPGVLIQRCIAEYETTRSYAHIDCPGHADYIKNMITGATPLDGGILVVSAADAPTPQAQTREHVLLARQTALPAIVVFLNVTPVDDPALLNLVEMEIRDLLKTYDFPGDSVPVIRGSASGALQRNPADVQSIRDLLNAVDRSIPPPQRPQDKPFLMPIEDVFSISGRGTVATGRIERGRVSANDPVQVIGFGQDQNTFVVELFQSKGGTGTGLPGDHVGLLLDPLQHSILRGQVLTAPGQIAAQNFFEAEVYVFDQNDGGGKPQPLQPGHPLQFVVRNAAVAGQIQTIQGRDGQPIQMILPGDHATITVGLVQSIAIEKGTRFAVRDGALTVGGGVVTRVPMPPHNP